jgi:prepilin-type N-terminal cleavage/methylation domain-containing protein
MRIFRNNRGFTLAEMLIASAIFVTVMVTAYSAFHSGMFGYRDISGTIDSVMGGRKVMERLNTDLRNSFAYSGDETFFSGTKDGIDFLTISDSFNEAGIVEDFASVSYRLKDGLIMRLCRKGKESLNVNSKIPPQELAAEVRALTFSYGYIEEGGVALKWRDSWDQKRMRPQAVRVALIVGKRTPLEFSRIIFLAQP